MTARTHPIKADQNRFGIFDSVTNTAVFPLNIKDGEISDKTFSFSGRGKVNEMDHKLGEMIHTMSKKGAITKKSDGESTILDCSGIFKSEPFSFVNNLQNFNGIVKLNFKNEKIFFFEALEEVPSFTWTPKSKDHFEFRKDGRHPQSSHKIFSEIMQRSGFMFSEVFSHEACMNLVVENMSEGTIGNLVMSTFVGERGKKHHRGIKMIQDSSTYIWPYLWTDQKVLDIEMGTDHKYRSIKYVCPTMKNWATQFSGGISEPVIIKICRGRGRNHTRDVTVSITHQLMEIEQD
jgi:hypothetical protein